MCPPVMPLVYDLGLFLGGDLPLDDWLEDLDDPCTDLAGVGAKLTLG